MKQKKFEKDKNKRKLGVDSPLTFKVSKNF